jgi:hypothetical protein
MFLFQTQTSTFVSISSGSHGSRRLLFGSKSHRFCVVSAGFGFDEPGMVAVTSILLNDGTPKKEYVFVNVLGDKYIFVLGNILRHEAIRIRVDETLFVARYFFGVSFKLTASVSYSRRQAGSKKRCSYYFQRIQRGLLISDGRMTLN